MPCIPIALRQVLLFAFALALLVSPLYSVAQRAPAAVSAPPDYRVESDPRALLRLREEPSTERAATLSGERALAADRRASAMPGGTEAGVRQPAHAPTLKPAEASRFYWGEKVPLERLEAPAPRSMARSGAAAADSGMVLVETRKLPGGASAERYTRTVDGVEVFQKELRVLRDPQGSLVAGSGSVSKALPRNAGIFTGPGADKTMLAAVQAAIRDLSGGRVNPDLEPGKLAGAYRLFDAPDDAAVVVPPRARPVWYELNGELLASYYIELQLRDPDSGQFLGYAYVIEAEQRQVLLRRNQVQYQQPFTYRGFFDDPVAGEPAQGPHGDVLPKLDDGPDKTSLIPTVFAELVSWSGLTTRDPWLPQDADSTLGNNVFAYADHAEPQDFSPGDILPTTTGPMVFDYALDRSEPADSPGNAAAATVNMFIMNNYLHDWWYDYGFDEAAGNAQEDNYGRGGLGGDRLHAQAQDFSGLNNANMFTPADGRSPRMQQYLYNDKDATNGVDYGVTVTSHPALGQLDPVVTAVFGPLVYELSATEIVSFVDGSEADGGDLTDACEAAADAAAVNGKIALVIRGGCLFTEKVANAQAAGAVGVLIYNDTDDGTAPPMGGANNAITIPSAGIGNADGLALRALIDDGAAPTVSMFNTFPLKDSSFDNGIIAHEWGHYIQNRLVGNGAGLSSFQSRALGEGWSDFHSMIFLVEEEQRLLPGNEDFSVPYTTGTYVEDFSRGIRRAPYTTDMSINPLTFAHIEEGAEPPGLPPTNVASPHAAGEIWATVLWDLYANLLNRYAFDEAQARMARYLVGGYMMTPIDPTYTEARDALLAVMLATDPADYEEAVPVFARRGLGFGAVSPPRYSTTLEGVVESFETQFSEFSATASLDTGFSAAEGSYCTADAIFDVGETARLRIVASNRGSEVLESLEARVTVLSGQEVTLENGGVGTFPALGLFEEAEADGVLLTLQDAAVASNLSLRVDFSAPNDATVQVPKPILLDYLVNYDGRLREPVDGSDTAVMESVATRFDLAPRVIAAPAEKAEALRTGPSLDFANTDFISALNPGIDFGQATLFIPNADYSGDLALETVPFTVSETDPLVVEFWHFYWIEDSYDGGVIEVQVDGGEWVDVTEAGGAFSVGYSGVLDELLPGRQVFTGINGDLASSAGNLERIYFGTALAGREVALRFRIVSDNTVASYGWNIDNLTLSGIASPVFHDLVAGDTQPCDNRPPHVRAGTASRASGRVGDLITLSAGVEDPDGDTLSYSWRQVSGPAVTVMDGALTTSLESAVAPAVAFVSGTASETVTFRLTDPGTVVIEVAVSDGNRSIVRLFRVEALVGIPLLPLPALALLVLVLLLVVRHRYGGSRRGPPA